MRLNKEMSEVRAFFMSVNDSFFKIFTSANAKAIEDLYDNTMNHFEIKMFELGISGEKKETIKTSLEFLINKHLSIFFRVYINHEDTNTVIAEVLELTYEELKDFGNFIKYE